MFAPIDGQQPAQPDASNSAGSTQSTVQPTYNFPPVFNGASPHVSSAAYPAPPQVIDPCLLPLPEDDDLDLSDPLTIAKLRGLKAAPKVAGARRKGKGKKRQLSSDSEDSDAGEPVPKRGRLKGSPNFSKDDITNLLDLVEKILPLGQKGWKTVKRRYQKWARGAKRPERDGKSLETKYKQAIACAWQNESGTVFVTSQHAECVGLFALKPERIRSQAGMPLWFTMYGDRTRPVNVWRAPPVRVTEGTQLLRDSALIDSKGGSRK
ncbi:hypothetical protein DFH09DRAFT_1085682 [Mycena vulgaris]|nr:hypothetical protein DFH09DRAFT_1085682 [Mycena vulgaris]